MIKAAGLALLAVMVAAPLQAQDVDCADAVTQQEMNFCAQQDWQAADAALNEAYGDAMAMMKTIDADLAPDEKGAEVTLRAAQRSWVAFRDAECAAEGYTMQGGSAQPLVIYGCLARLTAVRADDLAQLAQTY